MIDRIKSRPLTLNSASIELGVYAKKRRHTEQRSKNDSTLSNFIVLASPSPLRTPPRLNENSQRVAGRCVYSLPRCESYVTLSIEPCEIYPERLYPRRITHRQIPNPFRIRRNDSRASTTSGTDIKDNPPHCPSSAKNHPSSRCGSMRPLSKVSIPPQGISSAPKSYPEPYLQSVPHALLSKCSLI